jgi:hypothetical protein
MFDVILIGQNQLREFITSLEEKIEAIFTKRWGKVNVTE